MEYSITKLIEEAIRQKSISSLSIDFRYSHMARKNFFTCLLLSSLKSCYRISMR